MKALEQRLIAVEDRLAASEATVAAQKEQLQALPQVGQAPSGMDKFLNSIVIGGHATASYAYNFNDPDFNDVGGPGGQPFYQFNREHNTFSVDAMKLEIGKPASEPGSAGFQIDLLFGENAGILNAGLPIPTVGAANDRAAEPRHAADLEMHLQEGYASYNLNGIELRLGKWETLLGYEVLDSPYNKNITQGWLYTFAIPLFHTGLLAQGSMGEGLTWAAGIVNGFNNSYDFNDNKGLTGRLAYAGEGFGAALNAFVGAERSRSCQDCAAGVFEGDDNRPLQVYDLILTAKPSDTVDLWLNIDYGTEEWDRSTATPPAGAADTEDTEWYGAALGGMLALSEKTSVAVRGEWFRDDGGTRLYGAATQPAPGIPFGEEVDVTSLTVTLAHKLTPNLTARMELRHDTIDGRGGEGAADAAFAPTIVTFPKSDGDFDDQQDVGILEVSYIFD